MYCNAFMTYSISKNNCNYHLAEWFIEIDKSISTKNCNKNPNSKMDSSMLG
jgi:hypothetical protein